ncbi:ATP-dependent RNA helicase chl1 [Rhypophila decipiens]|uniref:ATP-dependent DNA helicase CHL1 n=1 Tax=Rhypophila decipiens TaxID=261697 RepID=A0AAN7B0E3_9PEZI|nr:ATP-dependent RNA helicase chl1 [Rhypophila decipiens]
MSHLTKNTGAGASSATATTKDEPINFHHPFTPYDVQIDFMRAVYDTLETGNGQVGILESPTGTGKSLSLICGALTWLRSHKRRLYEADFQSVAEKMVGEPDWMVENALLRKREDLQRKWEAREKRLGEVRNREKQEEEDARLKGRGAKRARLDGGADERTTARRTKGDEEEEKEFLIGDWSREGGDVDDDEDDPLYGISKETRALLERTGLGFGSRAGKLEEEEGKEEDQIKIYYTSRTHSQLTQFISELRRPEFPPSVPSGAAKTKGQKGDGPTSEVVKQVPLSSRQKLCINPTVNRLGSLQAINDRCTEMQQSKSAKKCSFMPSAENIKTTHQFRDTVMATLPDIEDMFRIGKEVKVCPYYASRTAIPGAEVVTLPYPLLLQKSARDALGIKLEGNIVIIDEAHNIMDAVANVHAAEIKLSELRRARKMLGVYVKRFGKKLKGENRVLVAQVGRVIESLSEWLDARLKAKGDQGIADTNDLLKARGADQINLYELTRYIQESKLAYKVESYASHIEEEQIPATSKQQLQMTTSSVSSPVLHTLVSFLNTLTNLSTEGRVFYEKIKPQPGTSQASAASPDIKLSYLLLSPTHAFSSIASSARAVILAGGTMSPFEDYKAHLFPTFPPAKITTISCGHVIPSSNLCVWTLGSTRPSPPGTTTTAPDAFEFSFQKRSDMNMVRQLGLAILNICTVVPDGVVVFFPSYGYLDEVVSIWQSPDPLSQNAAGPAAPQKSIWDRLGVKKALFRESKGGSSDDILAEYSNAVLTPDTTQNNGGSMTTSAGALLLSVVGGKMSEGINFSDRLGRCVVIVGLPYPNINSPEWKARIEYIESTALSRSIQNVPPSEGGENTVSIRPTPQQKEQAKQAARDFYENACMRAVNQSIGRAIRHRGDYAAIVLVDRRFGTERIKTKLPGWIRGGIVEGSEKKGLGGLMGALSSFFRGKAS